jgi:hypothetical protein
MSLRGGPLKIRDLLNRYRVKRSIEGFESLSLRHTLPAIPYSSNEIAV